MEIILLVVAIVLLVAVLLVVILKKNNTQRTDTELSVISGQLKNMDARFADELARNRSEMSRAQTETAEKTEARLSEMNDRINKLTLTNLEQQNKINETVSVKLENIRQSNENKLDQMRETVDEKLSKTLTARLDGSFKQVSQQLESVYKSLGEVKTLSSGVTNNINALNRVLTNVKARGTWAEVQLGNILDQTIPGMYETNMETVAGSGERVEFAVKVPGDDDTLTYIPVDSKFPMEDYIRLTDAVDSGIKENIDAARKMFEKSVEIQAKRVTKYINAPVTTSFAILYLATESLYAEIASSRTGLMERLQSKYKILVAGPSMITAMLNTLAMGFKTVAINKKADEIAHSLAAAKTQYGKFSELLDSAFKRIEDAGKKVDEARKRNNIIQKKLKSFESLEETDASNVLEAGSDRADSNKLSL